MMVIVVLVRWYSGWCMWWYVSGDMMCVDGNGDVVCMIMM